MTHKVHPKAHRLKKLEDWSSRWLSKKKTPQYLEEDHKIREYLNKRIGKFGMEKVEIERFTGKTIVIVFTSRPGLIIGRGGTGLEDLKKELERIVFGKKPVKKSVKKKEIKIEIKEIKDPWSSAYLTAQWVAQQLERRMPHRKTIKQAMEKVINSKEVEGARIEVAGRLGGTDIARRESLKKGRLPLQTIRADIDYGFCEAVCTYGTIGIKVWLYKGEKFE